MSFVLAIDQSTSATKAVLFNDAGAAIDRESREHRQIYPQPGWVEHDAVEIWQNVVAVISALACRRSDEFASAVALAIANQRETFVVFDRRTGKPLHNAIVWQCRRGAATCQRLQQAGNEELVSRKTGLKIDTYFSAPKIAFLLQENPDLRRGLESGEACVGTIDSYLIHRLTRGEVFATDSTNASRTLLYDAGRLRWDEELCNLFNVPMRALPEVRESFAEFGASDVAGTLPRKLPLCGTMGDSQASLFSQCCFDEGMAKATFGSGTSVMLNTGDKFKAGKQGSVTALAWVWRGKPVYALEGLINYSSATIAWLKQQLELIDDVQQTAAIAKSVEDNGGVYFVPAFGGLSAPHWCPEARAAVLGMTAHTRKEHVVRAALEAIAYQVKDVLNMMQREAGVRPSLLYADGGPTQNDFLMQFTADITGLDVVVSDVAESSARGAAMAAMLGLGKVKSLAELSKLRGSSKTYRPSMAPDKVNHLYSEWQKAVERVVR